MTGKMEGRPAEGPGSSGTDGSSGAEEFGPNRSLRLDDSLLRKVRVPRPGGTSPTDSPHPDHGSAPADGFATDMSVEQPFHAPVVAREIPVPAAGRPEASPETRFVRHKLRDAARDWGSWVRAKVERGSRSNRPDPAYDTDHFSEEHFFRKERRTEEYTATDRMVFTTALAMLLAALPQVLGDAVPDQGKAAELWAKAAPVAVVASVAAPVAAATPAPEQPATVDVVEETASAEEAVEPAMAEAVNAPIIADAADTTTPVPAEIVEAPAPDEPALATLAFQQAAQLNGPGLYRPGLHAGRRFAEVRYGAARLGPLEASAAPLKTAAITAMALPDPAAASAREQALALEPDRVEEIQQRLELADLGPVESAAPLDGATRSAIARLQRREGLPVTGYLDAESLDALDAATDKPLAALRARERAARARAARRAPAESPIPPRNAPTGPVRGADGCLRNADGRLLPGQGLRCDVRGLVQGGDASPDRLKAIDALADEAGADR